MASATGSNAHQAARSLCCTAPPHACRHTAPTPTQPLNHLYAEGQQLGQALCQRARLVPQHQAHARAQQAHLAALPPRVLQEA